MHILYDLEADEMMNLRNFNFEIERNARGLAFPSSMCNVYRISFDVSGCGLDYIKDWQSQSRYKRELFITNGEHTIKLIGSFIRGISYVGTSYASNDLLRVELSCDVHHIQDTFPELKRIHRDKILTSLGID